MDIRSNTLTPTGSEYNCMMNNLPARVMRLGMETKANLGPTGSIYVGLGTSEDVNFTYTSGTGTETTTYNIPKTTGVAPSSTDWEFVCGNTTNGTSFKSMNDVVSEFSGTATADEGYFLYIGTDNKLYKLTVSDAKIILGISES